MSIPHHDTSRDPDGRLYDGHRVRRADQAEDINVLARRDAHRLAERDARTLSDVIADHARRCYPPPAAAATVKKLIANLRDMGARS